MGRYLVLNDHSPEECERQLSTWTARVDPSLKIGKTRAVPVETWKL